MFVADVTGDLPEIIGNEERLYEGDLSLYFRILFFESSNLNNPYHNFRHTLHVVWLCHKACGIAFIAGLSAGAKRVIRSLTCLDTKRCRLSSQQAPIA